MLNTKVALFVGLVASIAGGCSGEPRFKWAFAQNIDGTLHPNEVCRESLAQSLYDAANSAKTTREATSNIFVFRGAIESYRIYAFQTQSECETALTNLAMRRRLQPNEH